MGKNNKSHKGEEMVEKIDWEKYKDFRWNNYTQEELAEDTVAEVQPKWKIPDKVCIQCAISGGGARLHNANPNQPRNLDDIHDQGAAVIEVGASVVHFDFDLRACLTKDGKEIPIGESYLYVVNSLLEKYGREKMVPHINCLRGTFQQQMLPIISGLAELTYVHPKGSPTYNGMVIPLIKKHGLKGEIVVHVNTEVDLAQRFFIQTGLMPNPNLWIVLPACPSRSAPGFLCEYMPNERSMARGLVQLIESIKEVDPGAFITLCAAGRATRYLTTLGLLLGINIRMGMEDTVWKYPHKDEKIKNNADELRDAIAIARLLGREMMTPNEYRETVGLKPRFNHLPK